MFIIFSVTSISSSGLLTWAQYYKISLLFSNTTTSRRINILGIIGGILIGIFGGIVVLISSLHHFYLSNPSIATFTLNESQFGILSNLERLIFLFSVFLNIGSQSYMITLLVSQKEMQNSSKIFTAILFAGILSDLLAIIGSAIFFIIKSMPMNQIALILINWIRFSHTINIWSQSYSTDIFKIVMAKKRATLGSCMSIGKLDAFSTANIMKTLPDE